MVKSAGRASRRALRLARFLLLVALVAGCRLPSSALDGPLAVPLRITATLPLDALTEMERPAFDAAADWYLLLVEVEGARATAAIRSSFSAPIRSGS